MLELYFIHRLADALVILVFLVVFLSFSCFETSKNIDFLTRKTQNEVHFPKNELFLFDTIENQRVTMTKMKLKNYRIPWSLIAKSSNFAIDEKPQNRPQQKTPFWVLQALTRRGTFATDITSTIINQKTIKER
ncbi:MAG: hypothetical protein IJK41_10895 [Muribaculaceae bacterium]|nr:hypothetical protein [Muribaculaceae bacterium]